MELTATGIEITLLLSDTTTVAQMTSTRLKSPLTVAISTSAGNKRKIQLDIFEVTFLFLSHSIVLR